MVTVEKEPAAEAIVCLCNNVSRDAVMSHLRNRENNYDTLVRDTKVGTRCTACLLDLDLLVHEVTGERARNTVKGDPRPEAFGTGLIKVPLDHCNSAFFLIATVFQRLCDLLPMARCNQLPLAVDFRYSLRLLSDEGRCLKIHKGALRAGADVTIDLSSFPKRATRV